MKRYRVSIANPQPDLPRGIRRCLSLNLLPLELADTAVREEFGSGSYEVLVFGTGNGPEGLFPGK
jgi:hypothetical protein